MISLPNYLWDMKSFGNWLSKGSLLWRTCGTITIGFQRNNCLSATSGANLKLYGGSRGVSTKHFPDGFTCTKRIRSLLIPAFLLSGKTRIKDMTTRSIRCAIQQNTQGDCFPDCQLKWDSCPNLNWRKVWKGVWRAPVPPNWNSTYFLMLHRGFWTGEKARTVSWDRIPFHCIPCQTLETIEHIFWSCDFARLAWSRVEWELSCQISWTQVVSGDTPVSTVPRRVWEVWHRATIHLLWVERCGEVHGARPRCADRLLSTISKKKERRYWGSGSHVQRELSFACKYLNGQ